MLQLQSEILRRQGRFDEALEVIDQAIAMKKAIYGTEDHPSVAEALEVKVKIYHISGREEQKRRCSSSESCEIRRKAYGENHPEVAAHIHDLGNLTICVWVSMPEAVEQFEQARQITAAGLWKRPS